MTEETDVFEVATLRQYLLGRLDSEAEMQIEERLFVGDSALEENFSVAEDELIHDWVWKTLDWKDRRSFRRRFPWTLERTAKLRFARGLQHYVKRRQRVEFKEELKHRFSWLWDWSPAPVWSFAQAAVVVLVAVGGTWMYSDKLRLEGQLGQMAADRVALEDEIASLRGMGAPGSASALVATVWLTPGIRSRGLDGVEPVAKTAEPSLTRFQLDLGFSDHESYRAVLRGEAGDELWTQSKLRATVIDERVAVALTVPTEVLPQGECQFRLSGVSASGDLELVGRYYFTVIEE